MAYNRWRFPHSVKGRFASYPEEKTNRTFWRAIKAFMRLLFSRSDPRILEELQPWVNTSAYASALVPPGAHPEVTWIGHSTFLIRAGGKAILTDPIFDTLFYILRFKRLTPPGLALTSLPPIDAVLISHNHPDHMDESAIWALKESHDPLFLVPQGDKAWFDRRGFERVRECTWWETYELSPTVRCTFLPAIHWSRRGLFDHNRSLWGGWMIEERSSSPRSLYFAGDTAYGTHFKAIAEAYSHIDVALMPIGPAEPYELMRCSHMNPEEAGQAFLDLGAHCMVPMHWGAYNLGVEHPLEPIKRLQSWWKLNSRELQERLLWCMKIGETKLFPARLPYVLKPKVPQPREIL
jgi:L-ascorbate metabolism protein UlaG (beta-lactamase superfamily)